MQFPQLGEILGGKYRLDELIGEGGFAVVFRATDVTIERHVAVKILRPESGIYDPRRVARFVREAKTLGELSDPHTVQMFDFGRTEQGVLFMVFELLAGADLHDLLTERGTLTADEVTHVLTQVLSSLREAHGVGLIHRDIKPRNIRVFQHLDDPLRAKLFDFGIATHTGPERVALTKTGAAIGTLAYMSPEQMVGDNLTPASDLFSVGLVAYEALVGESRSARGDTIAGRPVTLEAREPLAGVVRRMLRFKAADRFQTAEEVLAALSGAIPAEPQPRQLLPLAPDRQPRPHVAPPAHEDRSLLPARTPIAVLLIGAFVVSAWWLSSARTSDAPQTPASEDQVRRALQSNANNREPTTVKPEPPAAVDEAPAEPPEPSDGCGEEPPMRGEIETLLYRQDLTEHTYRRYVPRSYDPERRHPVLLGFHTVGERAKRFVTDFRIDHFADEHGFVVIAPYDTKLHAWESEPSMAMFREMVARSEKELCIDPERIYALGHGAGGVPAESLTCEPWVAAVIATSYRTAVGDLPCPQKSTPYLHFNPLKSKHLPIGGGKNCTHTRTIISLEEQEALWRIRNRCSGARKEASRYSYEESTCYTWDCEVPFVSCHVQGGHGLPGGKPRTIDLLDCDGPTPDYPYLDRFATFFDEVAQ